MRILVCNQCGWQNSEFNDSCAVCGAPLPLDSIGVQDSDSLSFDLPSLELGLDPLEAGDKVAHFEVIEKIGQGGMGTVYKVRDLALDRFVALKVFRPLNIGLDKGYEYLLKEAKMASALNHPNIVTVHDITRNESLSFIAMEWLDGNTLNQLIPQDGLDVASAINYARQVAEGLAFAHCHGIIHRDIKPQNLMVTQNGELKILDFGVARVQQESDWIGVDAEGAKNPEHTAAGVLKGTMAYMSPEQIRGEEVDVRSDIFSFGVLLYQMFTGERPFVGEDLKTLSNSILETNPTPVTNFREDLPKTIWDLIQTCLAKNPADRFQSMEEIIERLPRRQSDFRSDNKPQEENRHTNLILVAVPLFLIAAVLWFPKLQSLWPTNEEPEIIAIAPFQNISGDPLDAYFSDGLTLALANQLQETATSRPNAWIVSPAEIRNFHELTARDLFDQFSADLLVSGSVRQLGDRRQLTINLTDTQTSRRLNTHSLDILNSELFLIQDQILTAVHQMLDWPENQSAIVKQSTSPPSDAYRRYIYGLGYLYRYDIEHNVDRAVDEFEQTIALDPNYAPAWLGLSRAYWLRWRGSRQSMWMDKAFEALERVQSIDASAYRAEIAVQQGHLFSSKGEFQKAMGAFQQALTLGNDNSEAWYGLASVYQAVDQPEKAEEAFLAALEISPNNWAGRNKLGQFYYANGFFDKAETIFKDQIERTPNNYISYQNLALVLQMKDNNEEALSILEKASGLAPGAPSVHANIGNIYFFNGDFENAAKAYRKSVDLKPLDPRLWSNLGDAYRAMPGFQQEGREAIEKASELFNNDLLLKPNNSDNRILLASSLTKLGDMQQAREILTLASHGNRPQNLYLLAVIHELWGEREVALDYLEKAIDRGYSKSMVERDPDLDDLIKSASFLRLTGTVQ